MRTFIVAILTAVCSVTTVPASATALHATSRTVAAASSNWAFDQGSCSLVGIVAAPATISRSLDFNSLGLVKAGGTCAQQAPHADRAYVKVSYTLPKAAHYGSVRVCATGGAFANFNEGLTGVAALAMRTKTGKAVGRVTLAAKKGTYCTPAIAVSSLHTGRVIHWRAGTTQGNHYLVQTFTVRWTHSG